MVNSTKQQLMPINMKPNHLEHPYILDTITAMGVYRTLSPGLLSASYISVMAFCYNLLLCDDVMVFVRAKWDDEIHLVSFCDAKDETGFLKKGFQYLLMLPHVVAFYILDPGG